VPRAKQCVASVTAELPPQTQWGQIPFIEGLSFCCKFNRKDGDVCCCAHTYNIAVQAALKVIKSNPNEHRHHYQHEANRAILPDHSQTTEAGDAMAP
jgi:hypothetical protein